MSFLRGSLIVVTNAACPFFGGFEAIPAQLSVAMDAAFAVCLRTVCFSSASSFLIVSNSFLGRLCDRGSFAGF